MTTPLATVANSIIEFILSLLRDPAALEELQKDPEAALAKSQVAGVCADDIRAVAPIVYDRPDVAPRVNPTPPPPSDNDVVNEISRITNNWTTIDNRATIVDQSTNQNIWTDGGDVTQIFDQSAGVASGDGSIAAGDDTTIDNSDNTDIDTDIDGVPTLPEGVLPDGLDELDELAAGGTEPSTDEPPADQPADDQPADEAPADEAPAPQPAEQLAAAADAGVPQEAVDVVEAVTTEPAVTEPAPAPAYETPAADPDESVWSEPADDVAVEEVVYPDELGEEQ